MQSKKVTFLNGNYCPDYEDDEHPELDFDPLDDTKLWPDDLFPWNAVGKMVLNKNPEDYFTEVEQASFGTGVLVDGLDFSDDKMLQGRTFSYSDTQRHRVGANYLQLPINAPKKRVATNQSGGQMSYRLDRGPFQNPHINYEPSILDGLDAPANTSSMRLCSRHTRDNVYFPGLQPCDRREILAECRCRATHSIPLTPLATQPGNLLRNIPARLGRPKE